MSSGVARDRKKRRQERRERRGTYSCEEVQAISLEQISSRHRNNATTIEIPPSIEEVYGIEEESPLVDIIKRKQRKDWAKFVALVDKSDYKIKKESLITRLSKWSSKISTPIGFLLNYIEYRNGYTIRSYFQFLVWLFYLNLFTFAICFACIILPTLIYPHPVDFSTYAMNQYYQSYNQTGYDNKSDDECSLTDPRCDVLNRPFILQINPNDTCLSNPFTASSCCSLHTQAFFVNSSRDSDWKKTLSDLISGTGFFSLNRLYLGYYRNLTKSYNDGSYFQTYNMGLAVFLTIFSCLIVIGIVILRKYGDGMKNSYVQSETFENNLFQYVFARWNYSITAKRMTSQHESRFISEIKNILFERNDKVNFKFDRAIDKILFQLKRICIWLLTLIIFAGAVAAVYFAHRFTFQERAKKELNDGASQHNRLTDMAIEYLPSAVVAAINIVSQFVFAYMRDFKLYTRTSSIRHYLIRVILMRLLLLFTFVFVIILQITCNNNECGRQSALISCTDIDGQATFIHCWETLIGQAMYRLFITDTAVILFVHLIVDPLRYLLACPCSSRVSSGESETSSVNSTENPPAACCCCEPLEFELVDYVLDLTYTQTLCWHGFLFSPFLPLMAAIQNILIFFVKWFILILFRKRSGLDLSPARARHIFTAVLLFSFVWALLPISFFATSLQPSRGCGPFRIYSHETNFYMYYSFRNLITQIQNNVAVDILLEITSAVVVIPVILILILVSCVLNIRRNVYRATSVELYKLLHASQKLHRIGLKNIAHTTTQI